MKSRSLCATIGAKLLKVEQIGPHCKHTQLNGTVSKRRADNYVSKPPTGLNLRSKANYDCQEAAVSPAHESV